ncbi:2-oxoglutarate-dependent dioxygenase [Scenedesmus sp. PABB004]|nr:2-oxoglutarate-dependent dioxygenase [Scenedesmus sp. PABB004]
MLRRGVAAAARAALAAPCAGAVHAGGRRSFTRLPVIDMSPLLEPTDTQDAAAVSSVVAQLHDACRHVGFFFIVGHGVPAAVTEGVLRDARAWFAQPVSGRRGRGGGDCRPPPPREQAWRALTSPPPPPPRGAQESAKRPLLLSPGTHFRGWQPLGANVTRHEGGFTRDMHEAIDFYREEDPDALQASGRRASPLHGPNLWPAHPPGFEALLRAYFDHCLRVGAALLRGIASGLGLAPDFFEASGLAPRASSYWVARAIFYPPLAPPGGGQHAAQQAAAAAGGEVGRETQLSCGEHTDYGLLTLVLQDPGVTALQVKNAAGAWIDAPPLPGSFVVNLGDMFKVLTNGALTPTLHRVVLRGDSASSRVSLPFFYETRFDAEVAPLPALCRGAPPRFGPVRYGDHLEAKVTSNFA